MTDAPEQPVGHTAGPWVSRGRYVGTPNHMSFVAECRDQNGNWSDTPMSVANARLIAAAPDLLAFAVALDADWTREFPDGPDTKGVYFKLADETVALWRQCRAAITKATS